MNSIIDDYIKLVIQPLENYKNMLINKQHLSESDPLIEKIDNDLFNKYKKLEELIADV